MAKGEKRDHLVNMRFSKREFESITDKVGGRNRSEVLRRLILGWVRSGQPDPTADDADV